MLNFSKTVLLALVASCALAFAGSAGAAQPTVGLGTASQFAVLGGSTVTNTGPSVINGDIGVSPGTAITGFPPGTGSGTMHSADGVADQAQADTTTAYNDAAGRTPATTVAGDLGGLTLTSGVYKSASSLGLTGDVTLDAQGDSNAVFIFQAGSSLTTASSSRVVLLNGADPCNVFWQIGSSATLGTNSAFKGTILALTSVTLTTGVKVDGRALARNGAVTLDTNTVTAGNCASVPAGSTPGTPAPGDTAPATTPGTTPGTTATPAGEGTAIFTSGPRPRPNRCIGGFTGTVTGLRIKRVVFTLDGHALKTLNRSPFSVRVRSLVGVHLLRARITFTDATKTANLRMRYRSCAAATKIAPRFTG